MLDPGGRVLLLRAGDPSCPSAGTWWFTPGGGLQESESFEDAARREVREETGLDIHDPGPVVRYRDAEFRFGNMLVHAHEAYFVVFVEPFRVSTTDWSDLERAAVVEWRWWPLEALRSTAETIYPEFLAELVEVHTQSA